MLTLLILAGACSLPSSPGRNGSVAVLDIKSGKQIWKVSPPITMIGPPIRVADELVVYGGNGCGGTGTVVGLDAANGKQRWSGPGPGYCASSGTFVAMSAVAAGSVIVPRGGRLEALDPRTGRTRWSQPFGGRGGPGLVSLSGSDGLVIAVSSATGVTAFDAASGAKRWTVAPVPGGYPGQPPAAYVPVETTAPALGDRAAYVLFANFPTTDAHFWLAALDTSSGRQLWKAPLEPFAPYAASPAVGQVVVTAVGNTVFALDPGSGAVRWRYSAGGQSNDGLEVRIDGSAVYVRDGPTLVALNAATGSELWRASASGTGNYLGQIQPGAGVVAMAWSQEVLLFDSASGKRLWTTRVDQGAGTQISVGPETVDVAVLGFPPGQFGE